MHAALRKVSEVLRDQLGEEVKLWARDVRELSYDMEDVVDTFLVRVEDGREATNQDKLKRLLDKMGNLFSKVKTRRQIADAIKDINKQIQEVANRHGRYTVDSIVAKPAAMSTVDPRLFAMYKNAAQLVGVDGQRDALIKMLSEGDDESKKKMKIVSVVGFGGLGKTTLAKAVYDKLKAGFDCDAFVPVGQNPNMKKVLKDILIDLDEEKYTNLNMTGLDERQLINKLLKFLENKRYFVVIDDIWDKKSWEIIRCALADSNRGSIVVATTRISEVATNAGDVYKLQPLSRDNSEKLFCTRIVDCEGKCPHSESTEPAFLSDKVVDYTLNVREEKDEGHCLNFCWLLWNPCVEKFNVSINCTDARPLEVEQAEVAARFAVDAHPNHPTLEMTRYAEDKMMLSDQHQQPGNEISSARPDSIHSILSGLHAAIQAEEDVVSSPSIDASPHAISQRWPTIRMNYSYTRANQLDRKNYM